MSIEVSLTCDGCGVGYGTTWLGAEEDWVRDVADGNGWSVHGRVDLCPECRLGDRQLVLAEFDGAPF